MSTHTNINMSRCFQFCSRSQLGTDPLSEHRYIHQKVRPVRTTQRKVVVDDSRGCCLFWCRAKPHFRACLAGWVQVRCVRGG